MDTVEEIFAKICEAQKWQKQELAEYIDVDPSTLSQKLGRHWNIHFRVFRRLLPFMLKLKIIKPDELHATSDNIEVLKSAKLRKSEENNKKRSRRRYIMETLRTIPVLSQ
jgi:transcriptional regulator with XRE-family HTH domain